MITHYVQPHTASPNPPGRPTECAAQTVTSVYDRQHRERHCNFGRKATRYTSCETDRVIHRPNCQDRPIFGRYFSLATGDLKVAKGRETLYSGRKPVNAIPARTMCDVPGHDKTTPLRGASSCRGFFLLSPVSWKRVGRLD